MNATYNTRHFKIMRLSVFCSSIKVSEIGTILVQIFHVLEILLTPANGKPKSVNDPLCYQQRDMEWRIA